MKFNTVPHKAFTLIEMLLALSIMVALTTATLSLFCYPRDRIAAQACSLRQSELQLLTEEYYRRRGAWPSIDLRELNTSVWSVPVCPLDGQTYRLDPSSGQVIAHTH